MRVRILLIEDSEFDARLVREHLARARGFECEVQWARTLSEALGRVTSDEFDVVLLDLHLPDVHGVATVARLREQAPHLPVIVITGQEGEAPALHTMRFGAQDYLVKSSLDASTLTRSIRFAIERMHAMWAGSRGLAWRAHGPDAPRPDPAAGPSPAGAAPSDEPPRPGMVLQGRYVLERQLGRGTYGCAFLALDRTLERQVVVKLLHRDVASDPEGERQFLKEARIVAALDHPRVVRLHDFGVHGKLPFSVMEHVEKGSLSGILREKRLTVAEATTIAEDLLEALAYVHSCGVLHRDIKPGNILIDGQGRAKLGDFGLALRGSPYDTLQRLGTGVVGSPAYAPPEASTGAPFSPAGDLYALGAVLFEAVTGTPHHEFKKTRPTKAQQRAYLEDAAGDAHGLVDAAMAALEKDARRRPQSAEEMRRLLAPASRQVNRGGRGGASGRRR